jgi:hypothetical protein
LTYAFSKKWDHLKAALALHFANYNFCRVHGSLGITPAMAVGVTDHIMGVSRANKRIVVGAFAFAAALEVPVVRVLAQLGGDPSPLWGAPLFFIYFPAIIARLWFYSFGLDTWVAFPLLVIVSFPITLGLVVVLYLCLRVAIQLISSL